MDVFLKGDLEAAMDKNCEEFKHIIVSLIEALKTWLQSLLENNMFKPISIIMDSESYKVRDDDIIYEEAKVIAESFKVCFLPKILTLTT